MGMFDNAKDLLGKAEDLAAEHADQVKEGIDKAEDFADKQTGGKYTEQIDGAGSQAEKYVQGLHPKDQ